MTTTDTASDAAAGDAQVPAYRVLARKYRPRTLAELVGQDALVRTLRNAIGSGRIAQAYMLTGVRGVGKTTTARIVARSLNCIGADGTGGPTITPCGTCTHCQAIASDRHVDVIEMDAASHTGIDDIREIIDGVRYSPVSARYKVYIIDEVHMLSAKAFNALLKTLEEPPAHVKFVFATTEIRKVPITVLSRCQRFDLRRVTTPTLVDHFTRIAAAEGIAVEPDALALIARAADGSVRDGLSLLDQAMAEGGATVNAAEVRDMLGLADRTRIIDLFEAVMGGTPADALAIAGDLHQGGADPQVVLRDLLDLTHALTRFKVVPETLTDPATPEAERVRGGALSQRFSIAALARAWQVLLKGLGEVSAAPVAQQALEMVLIRLAHAARLPPPAELVRALEATAAAAPTTAAATAPSGPAPTASAAVPTVRSGPADPSRGAAAPTRLAAAPTMPPPEPTPPPPTPADCGTVEGPRTFRDVVALFQDRREVLLHAHLYAHVYPVRTAPGRLEFRPTDRAPRDLATRVAACLTKWTGRQWMVGLSRAPGEPTLADQDAAAESQERAEASRHPVVRALLDEFPGARITRITPLAPPSDRGGDPAAAIDEPTEDP